MSIALTSAFLSAPSALNAETRPIRAVKIVPSAPAGGARRPFHLVLALDVSGSMDGPRIVAVQRTLALLLDGLANGDTLSMISYESRARILARAVQISAESRPTLITAVDNLRADGGTNLEAALLSLREITSDSTVPTVDAVFVLTDGHINQGLTSSVGLTRLLTAAVPSGTPVFTLGFGADHNSRMLRDMALRTRGSYTYADAAELIPATIADIMTGLATEVGRGGRLLLPAGWRALEITAGDEGATEFNVGALIADKEQWVVLEGPPGPCDPPVLTFLWRSADGTEHTETCSTFTDFESVLVSEQYCRCRVATVQTSVQEMLEARRIDEARVALTELGTWLDASPAHDRPFVISLRAQVDEMVEALRAPAVLPGLARAGGGGTSIGLAPILSRMASNTAALGAQRGMMSHISSVDPADPSVHTHTSAGGAGGRASASGVTHMFCSPSQQRSITTTRARYSQMASVPAPHEDEMVDLDSVARSLGLALPPVLQRTSRLSPLATEEEPNEPLMTPPAPAVAPAPADGLPPV